MYKHGAWLSLVKVTQCILTMKVEHTCTDMGLYFFLRAQLQVRLGSSTLEKHTPKHYPRNTPQNFMARHEKKGAYASHKVGFGLARLGNLQ